METFRTMMIHGDLAPVGHKISLRITSENPLIKFFDGNQYWVDSGTSALALAILDAKINFPKLQNPRVIIPGYCCPDLVAACIYAGVEPVVVDISANDPAYDLDCLRAQLDERVIAVIAVNFLGVSERLSDLRQLIDSLCLHARLIEDNAQWFPAHKTYAQGYSDYTVFSFGRGKPLSLLGGGLLLTRVPIAAATEKQIRAADKPSRVLSLKIHAYNFLLTPQFYLLVNRNPFLHLGETKYIAMDEIHVMDEFRYALLGANFERYVARKSELMSYYDEHLGRLGSQRLAALDSSRARQLLRYPLLCSSAEHRTYLLRRLGKLGLGATAMYSAAIDQISNVSELVCVPSVIVNAQNFASRLITLPLHAGVTPAHRRQIIAILQEERSSG